MKRLYHFFINILCRLKKRSSLIGFIKSSRKTLLLMLIVIVASVATTTIISISLNNYHNFSFPSLGNIKTIGVEAYWDSNCENRTTLLNWGTLWIGSSYNTTLFIKSVSNYDVTLNLNVTDWEPDKISDHLMLSWDYDGKIIQPGEIVKVVLTSSIDYSGRSISYLISNRITDFNFEIHILASEN